MKPRHKQPSSSPPSEEQPGKWRPPIVTKIIYDRELFLEAGMSVEVAELRRKNTIKEAKKLLRAEAFQWLELALSGEIHAWCCDEPYDDDWIVLITDPGWAKGPEKEKSSGS